MPGHPRPHSHLFSSKMTHERAGWKSSFPRLPSWEDWLEGGVLFSVSSLYFNSLSSGGWMSAHEKEQRDLVGLEA